MLESWQACVLKSGASWDRIVRIVVGLAGNAGVVLAEDGLKAVS